VGGIEALALMASAFQPKGAFCGAMQTLNGNLGKLGYFIVGLFALSWILSILFLQMATARRVGSMRRCYLSP
jgi:high-affinity nickel-transport protein